MTRAHELREALAAFKTAREKLASVRLLFDPGQPRDEQGQWGEGGFPGASAPEKKVRVVKPALQKGERADFIKKEKDALRSAIDEHVKNPTPESLAKLRGARDALKEKRSVAGAADPDNRARFTPEKMRERRIAHEDSELAKTPKGKARAEKAQEFFDRNTSDAELKSRVTDLQDDYQVLGDGDFWSRKGDFKRKKWDSHVKSSLSNDDDLNYEVESLGERLRDSGVKAPERSSALKSAKKAYKDRLAAAAATDIPQEKLDKAKEYARAEGIIEMVAPVPKALSRSAQERRTGKRKMLTSSSGQMTLPISQHSLSRIAAVLRGELDDPEP